MRLSVLLVIWSLVGWAPPAEAQGQSYFSGSDITGQLVRIGTAYPALLALNSSRGLSLPRPISETTPRMPPKRLHPPVSPPPFGMTGTATQFFTAMRSIPVVPWGTGGFDGLTHRDQREAAGGNQFSVEPPNQSIAAANGYVLLGVNNAVQVYNASGQALLPRALSSNELFGLAPAIDWYSGLCGPFPTDMRVFFDHGISRWFVLQRELDYNPVTCKPASQSHLYLAVSQSANPTGAYTIYSMDTTNAGHSSCPCIADYPQIGADQYGFFISVNEFTISESFVDSAILSVSKTSLAAGAATPTIFRTYVPFSSGFGFAIQPATTPPGASYFVASGGLQYFVSSRSGSSVDSTMAVWAMYNTASLQTTTPNLVLTRISLSTLEYTWPGPAAQKPGLLPYGSTLYPPGSLAYLDGGDLRIQSLSYAGGRLYTTLQSRVRDEAGRFVDGGAYVVMSPTFRNGILAASVLQQGYLMVAGNHILRPAIAVNAQGRGGVGFTLAGPDYFPSAAFVPFDRLLSPSLVQVAAFGAGPEDGFTGYPGGWGSGTARWGDYSTAVVGNDGYIWMVAQYIPNAPRSEYANWGTFVWRHLP
jgi:hypothetical protein